MSVCVRSPTLNSQNLEPMGRNKRFRVFRNGVSSVNAIKRLFAARSTTRASRSKRRSKPGARASRFSIRLVWTPPGRVSAAVYLPRLVFATGTHASCGETAVVCVPDHNARAHVEARAHRRRLEPRARPPGRSRRRAEGWPSSWDRAGSVGVRSSPFEPEKHHGRPVAASEAPRGPRPPA